MTTSPEHKRRILIIGSGPCGLGAAYRCEELMRSHGMQSYDYHVVDASSQPAGLSQTVTDEKGFLWDMGGHVIFSHYNYFTELLTALIPEHDWNTLEREAWVWMKQRYVPYPFQNNLSRLPADDQISCISGLVENEANKYRFNKPVNFAEWLHQSFGAGLCDLFMVPYNYKVWAYQPKLMNVEWMGERVATVNTQKVITNVIKQIDDLGWGPNATFKFPKFGGTGHIWTSLYNKLPRHKFALNRTVTHIDAAAHVATFSDGSTVTYDALISTMPMDQLISMTHNMKTDNSALKEKAKQFKYSSSHIIGFGLTGQPPESLRTKCWLYFPESDCPFYRCTVFSNYSSSHVPKPGQQWSIMCEVSESCDKPVNMETIMKEAEQGLINTCMISADTEIVSRFHHRLEYGYPTPFVGRDDLCRPLFTELEQSYIYSRGRFGGWKYEVGNQDHSMMQGVEAMDRVIFGTDEPTINTPGIVNGRTDKYRQRQLNVIFDQAKC